MRTAQYPAGAGICSDMSHNDWNISLIDTVRCLGCGHVYTKPNGGGTARANPGCPRCAYVGWLSTAIPLRDDSAPHRYGVGRPPTPFAQPG